MCVRSDPRLSTCYQSQENKITCVSQSGATEDGDRGRDGDRGQGTLMFVQNVLLVGGVLGVAGKVVAFETVAFAPSGLLIAAAFACYVT